MDAAGVIASMRKTGAALACMSVALAMSAGAALMFGGRTGFITATVCFLPALALAWLAVGSWQVAQRQRRIFAGEPDLYLQRNERAAESAVLRGAVPRAGAARHWLARSMFGHRYLIGDLVRIKSAQAIRATLDAQSCVDGLPFMDEMAEFCGRTARVYRVVDKIYDYGRSSVMRRLDGCVLLAGLRCDGASHGGCEAACYIVWKACWLEPTDLLAAVPLKPEQVLSSRAGLTGTAPFHCQYTELTAASKPSAKFTVRGSLGPLVAGNVTLSAFATAITTKAFNAVQGWRGGVAFPASTAADGPAPVAGTPLQAGEWVRIRLPHEIARTLDKNSKNRGLWFDIDMLKFCGQHFQVRGRVQQIIDVRNNAMIPMKTPCITLHDVHYTGEFQGFGEQHDFLYWREAWLQRTEPPPVANER